MIEMETKNTCPQIDLTGTPVDYLDNEVFPILLPALKDTLDAAKLNNCLFIQKSRFNGIDYLSELLWNRNPKHNDRDSYYTEIFDIPFAVQILKETPRPIYPKSWLWSETEAVTVIQAAVRGFLVRCIPEVQEVRQFWKTLAQEKNEKKSEQENTEEMSKIIENI